MNIIELIQNSNQTQYVILIIIHSKTNGTGLTPHDPLNTPLYRIIALLIILQLSDFSNYW